MPTPPPGEMGRQRSAGSCARESSIANTLGRSRFAKNLLTVIGLQVSLRRDFDPSTKSSFELRPQLTFQPVDTGCAGLQVQQDVQVAVWTLLPTSERPDDGNPADVILPTESVPVLAQVRGYFRRTGSGVAPSRVLTLQRPTPYAPIHGGGTATGRGGLP